MRIGMKLLFAFLGLTALSGLVGLAGLVGTLQIGRADAALYNDVVVGLSSLSKLNTAFQRININLRDLVYSRDRSESDNLLKSISPSTTNTSSSLRAAFKLAADDYAQDYLNDEDKTSFAVVLEESASFFGLVDQIIELVGANRLEEAQNQVEGELRQAALRLNDRITRMIVFNMQNGSKASRANQELVGSVSLSLTIVLSLAFAISLLLGYLFAKSIAKPLAQVSRLAAEIAAGTLTAHADPRHLARKDEVGTLARSMDSMITALHTNVSTVITASGQLKETSAELQTSMATTGQAINHISGHVETVNQLVVHQSASVTETSATSDQILGNLEKLDTLIASQAASVNESSASIEVMISTIHSVTRNIEQLGQAFTTLQGVSGDGMNRLAEMIHIIQDMIAQSTKLQEANSVINGITAQTNLLAMNAAIEAAHAGDSGRGFSVVADEIRKLAELSARQSGEIASDIKTIQDYIKSLSTASATSEKAFQSIVSQIEVLGRFEAEITRAMNEQALGSKQVLEATQEINQITATVQSHSAEMLDGSRAISSEMRNLLAISGQVRTSMGTIQEEAGAVRSIVNQVSELSQRNSRLSDSLEDRMSMFVVA